MREKNGVVEGREHKGTIESEEKDVWIRLRKTRGNREKKGIENY